MQSLTVLFAEASKLVLNEKDFMESLAVLSWPRGLGEAVMGHYIERRDEIRSVLSELTLKFPKYVDLDWRLDVQVASRTVQSQTNPVYLLCLRLEDAPVSELRMQTDYSSLKHICEKLEQALAEARSTTLLRVSRKIK